MQSQLTLNSALPPLPPRHPNFRMLNGMKIARRALALDESGLTGEATAIMEALDKIKTAIEQEPGGRS